MADMLEIGKIIDELTLYMSNQFGDIGTHILKKVVRDLNIKSSSASYDDIRRLVTQLGKSIAVITSREKKEKVESQIRKYLSALKVIQNAAAHKKKEVIRAYLDVVGFKIQIGDWKAAIGFCEKAEKIAETLKGIDRYDAISRVCRRKAYIYRQTSEYENALQYYQRAIDHAKKTGNAYEIAMGYGGLGYVYWRKGMHRDALKCYDLSKEFGEKIADERKRMLGLGTLHIEYGNVYLDLENTEKAIEHCLQAIEHLRKIKENNELARVYNNIARVYEDTGNYEKAIEYYKLSVNTAEIAGATFMKGWALFNMANTYISMYLATKKSSYLEKAKKCALESINTLDNYDNMLARGRARNVLARLYGVMKDSNNAKKTFMEAIGMLENLGVPDYLAMAYHDLGVFYADSGDPDNARAALEKARALFKKTGQTKKLNEIDKLIAAL